MILKDKLHNFFFFVYALFLFIPLGAYAVVSPPGGKPFPRGQEYWLYELIIDLSPFLWIAAFVLVGLFFYRRTIIKTFSLSSFVFFLALVIALFWLSHEYLYEQYEYQSFISLALSLLFFIVFLIISLTTITFFSSCIFSLIPKIRNLQHKTERFPHKAAAFILMYLSTIFVFFIFFIAGSRGIPFDWLSHYHYFGTTRVEAFVWGLSQWGGLIMLLIVPIVALFVLRLSKKYQNVEIETMSAKKSVVYLLIPIALLVSLFFAPRIFF